MNVQYWPVGQATPGLLPLTQAQISTHLLADWVPSLPASLGTAIFGWPQHLTEVVPQGNSPYLALHRVLRSTERQWKGVLSWMLGVAGTRQVLEQENYRWIAPLSAFYPRAKPVSTPHWHVNFANGVLSAYGNPAVSAKLKPDYLALRTSAQSASGFEWAAVESKGTARSLAKLGTCPNPWYNQARNVVVYASGSPIAIQRHVVVATRSCTDGSRTATRRIQVRAWNSNDEMTTEPPMVAAVEVAAAHLFGLCRNLGLTENAHLLGTAPWRERGRSDLQGSFLEHTSVNVDGPGLYEEGWGESEVRVRNPGAAERELLGDVVLRDRGREHKRPEASRGVQILLEVERRPVQVDLDAAIVDLIHALGRAEEAEDAIMAFETANRALDVRPRLSPEESQERSIGEVAAGVRLTIAD